MEPSMVKDKEGKFLTVEDTPEGMKMCAVEHQNEDNAPSVQIKERLRNDKIEIAFIFQHEDKLYFPKVDGKTLTVEKAADCTDCTISDSQSSWFQKLNQGSGDHYSLQFADAPLYLSRRLSSRRKSFILTDKYQDCVLITDKKKKKK